MLFKILPVCHCFLYIGLKDKPVKRVDFLMKKIMDKGYLYQYQNIWNDKLPIGQYWLIT